MKSFACGGNSIASYLLTAKVAHVLEDVLSQVVNRHTFMGVKNYYHKHTPASKQRIVEVYRNLKRAEPNAPAHILMVNEAKLRAVHDADLSWRSIRR